MYAAHDTTTPAPAQPTADPPHPTASKLVGAWLRLRGQRTPWAYPYLRTLAAVRFAVGLFLTVLGAVFLARGDAGWAALPLTFAVAHFAIACLDSLAARSAPHRA